MSRRGYSLGRRLTFSLAGSLAVFFLIQTWMIGREVTLLSEQAMLSRLEHDQEAILAALSWRADGPQLDWGRVPVIYQRPLSGHYFELRAGGKTLRSRSLWDAALPSPPVPAGGIARNVAGPAGQRLLLFARVYDWHGRRVELRTAEDASDTERSAGTFQRHLLLFAAAAIVALLVLQGWIVQYGLRPLGQIRAQLRRLERGEIEAVSADAPEEIAPLVEEINRLAALIRQRLMRSRHALGDLAHALKTPMAAMLNALEHEPTAESWRMVRRRLREMETRIERELARARTAGRAPGGQWPEPQADLCELARVVGLAHGRVRIEVDAPEGMLPVDREDMLELIGNLLDNAAKWGRSRVRCSVRPSGEGLRICVEDDGPGLDARSLECLMARGARADETRPGHGLGLAIVREIVEAHEGAIDFRTASEADGLGGLCVRVDLPPGGWGRLERETSARFW